MKGKGAERMKSWGFYIHLFIQKICTKYIPYPGRKQLVKKMDMVSLLT